jgi:hypothetical protein
MTKKKKKDCQPFLVNALNANQFISRCGQNYGRCTYTQVPDENTRTLNSLLYAQCVNENRE